MAIFDWDFEDELGFMFAEQRTGEWARTAGRLGESQERLERLLDEYDEERPST